MNVSVVTLFPEAFSGFLSAGLLGKAVQGGLVRVSLLNPRDFTTDKHRSADDAPYGGGAGMVMRAPPIIAAVDACAGDGPPPHRVLLSPGGAPLDQARVRALAGLPHLVLVCGRYEGMDERVSETCIDEELSIGDYVLMGGEVAAMVVIEAVSRFVPGVLGEPESTTHESFEEAEGGLLEHPQYTRPPELLGRRIPEVLVSGDHEKVRAWRRARSLARTQARRPDLWRQVLAARQALAARTYVALVHHPVVDREGTVVTTAVTNLDIHDIARASRTFGLGGYFVVTPVEAQRELVGRIVGHWTEGAGREHNDKRTEAVSLVHIVESIEQACAAIAARAGRPPLVVTTSAAAREGTLGVLDLVAWLAGEDAPAAPAVAPAAPVVAPAAPVDDRAARPVLLVFGTGWGLAPEVLRRADADLAPITGPIPPGAAGAYNHLSVRSAVAIVLDRLFGENPPRRSRVDSRPGTRPGTRPGRTGPAPGSPEPVR